MMFKKNQIKMCVIFTFIYLIIIYIVIFVVSNQSDLFDKEQVSEEKGKKFMEEKNLSFFSVSAYSGAGIFLLFESIGMETINLKENENKKGSIILTKNIIKEKKKNKCYYCKFLLNYSKILLIKIKTNKNILNIFI